MEQQLLERARKGAAFLDETVPGWDKRVSLERLEMSSGDPNFKVSCVLCQVTGHMFYDGVTAVFGADHRELSELATYGFTLRSDESDSPEENTLWDGLNEAWTQVLRERRGEA